MVKSTQFTLITVFHGSCHRSLHKACVCTYFIFFNRLIISESLKKSLGICKKDILGVIHRHCEQDDSGILETKRTKTKTSRLDRKKFLTFLHSTYTAASFSRLRLPASNAYRGTKDKEGKVKRSYLLLGLRKCQTNHDLRTNMSNKVKRIS